MHPPTAGASAWPRTAAEGRVFDALAAGRDEIVRLAATLIAFDTTTREGRGCARQEQALQEYLADRLRGAGAEVDLWEPEQRSLADSRQVPADLEWAGYPQLLGRIPGSGGGRCLMLNGHIDVVTTEPRRAWTLDPFRAEVRDGLLYGRGAVDMKGGVACIVFAAEVLARCGVRLGGDLLISAVTDEESTSAGGVATLAHGVRADACIVAEPTALQIGIACRGSLMPSIRVHGRAGHVAAVQPHWRDGGAVSATEKAARVIDAVLALREMWRDDPAQQHPFLPPGKAVVTSIEGGQWPVSYADWCQIDCHISYLPSRADADGFGREVGREFTDWVHRYTAADPWLAEHPPEVSWSIDVPPSEVNPDEPVVRALQAVLTDLGRPAPLFGADYWNDGASFTRAGIPSVVFGPGHVAVAHSVDEHVPVDHLIATAQTLALTAMRFCADR
jgi:acetylornithine deacetylase